MDIDDFAAAAAAAGWGTEACRSRRQDACGSAGPDLGQKAMARAPDCPGDAFARMRDAVGVCVMVGGIEGAVAAGSFIEHMKGSPFTDGMDDVPTRAFLAKSAPTVARVLANLAGIAGSEGPTADPRYSMEDGDE